MKTFTRIAAAVALAFFLLGETASDACTSVIVSGRVTADGRPLMLKVRDQKESRRKTTIKYVEGAKYDYLSMTQFDTKSKGSVGGYNTAGLCIMSLTAHGFPLDTAGIKGGVLRHALEYCKNIREFDEWAAEYVKEKVVVSNIGIIDAEGGAAYYEFGGHSFVKYDVNDPAVAPDGWRCCTNFCWSGDMHKGGGIDRYENAVWAMESLKKNSDGKYELRHNDLLDALPRSYRQKRLGVESIEELSRYEYFFDTGIIGYRNTCGTITFEGVKSGEDPKYTVMWLQLGHAACCPAFPCILGDESLLPDYIWNPDTRKAQLYNEAMQIRDLYIYDQEYSKAKYFNVKNTMSLLRITRESEAFIDSRFYPIYEKWRDGKLSDREFYKEYRKITPEFHDRFLSDFKDYLKPAAE